MNDENERSVASAGSQGGDTESRWRQAAMQFGELIAGSGPDGYYDFTPEEWLKWAGASIITDEERDKASEAVMCAFLDRAKPTLTDDERQAIWFFAAIDSNDSNLGKHAAALRLLLERSN